MSVGLWLLLVLLGAIWGASFGMTAVALEDLSPAVVSLLRTGFAALVMLPVALARGALGGVRAHLGAVVAVGAIQLAGPFLLIGAGQLEVASGLAGVLVASTPLWTALLAVGLDAEERSHGLGLVGIVLGIVGVAVLLGIELEGSLAGALALLLAGLGYALGGFIVKHRLSDVAPLGVVAAAMVAGSVLLLPLALASAPSAAPGLPAVASAVVVGVVSGGLGWLIYYTVLARAGPAKAAVSIYLIPAFAVIYGVALLGEPMTVATALGLVLVLVGSWLAGGGRPPRRWPIPTRGAGRSAAPPPPAPRPPRVQP